MKTCEYCGCYVPDDWDSCPACGKHVGDCQLIYTNNTTDIINHEYCGYGLSNLANAVRNNERILPYAYTDANRFNEYLKEVPIMPTKWTR